MPYGKEDDAQWLNDVQPTINALVNYLTRENNGIGVYEVGSFVHPVLQKEIHKMSNHLDYVVDTDLCWEIVW